FAVSAMGGGYPGRRRALTASGGPAAVSVSTLPARSCQAAARSEGRSFLPRGRVGVWDGDKGGPVTLTADAESAGRAARRLRRHRRNRGAPRPGARGPIPGPGIRRDPPPTRRV